MPALRSNLSIALSELFSRLSVGQKATSTFELSSFICSNLLQTLNRRLSGWPISSLVLSVIVLYHSMYDTLPRVQLLEEVELRTVSSLCLVQQRLIQNVLNIDYMSLSGGQAGHHSIYSTTHTCNFGATPTRNSIHTSHESQQLVIYCSCSKSWFSRNQLCSKSLLASSCSPSELNNQSSNCMLICLLEHPDLGFTVPLSILYPSIV